MTKIQLSLPNHPYTIYLDEGLLDDFSSYLSSIDDIVIITDSGIPKKYITTVQKQLNDPLIYTIVAGEDSKNIRNYQEIIETMITANIPKSATIIALGGGVVGDLAGFIASTYMRGISFIQIPTTLLAQIDSSVGGKVAVNSHSAKNAIGSFFQPDAVFIDPNVLSTLEPKQLHSGIAELVKYGVIKDPSILEILEKDDLSEQFSTLILKAVKIKRDIVLKDEFDQGIRHILNYGHTIGHAIEQHSNYQYLHGESVAIGMAFMAKKTSFYSRLISILQKYDLPFESPYNLNELIPYLLKDKKIQKTKLHFIVVEKLGEATIKPIMLTKLKQYLEELS